MKRVWRIAPILAALVVLAVVFAPGAGASRAAARPAAKSEKGNEEKKYKKELKTLDKEIKKQQKEEAKQEKKECKTAAAAAPCAAPIAEVVLKPAGGLNAIGNWQFLAIPETKILEIENRGTAQGYLWQIEVSKNVPACLPALGGLSCPRFKITSPAAAVGGVQPCGAFTKLAGVAIPATAKCVLEVTNVGAVTAAGIAVTLYAADLELEWSVVRTPPPTLIAAVGLES